MDLNQKTIYSVSAKALIKNANSELLLVKEHSDNWALPGGGIEQGESAEAALRRELQEELNIVECKIVGLAGVFTYFAPVKNVWRMWLLYSVELPKYHTTSNGISTKEAAFINIKDFASSKTYAEQRIYQSAREAGIIV
ncbi:MAG TPA: NUDIX hydrolase [Candidatus Saccharimonadales bacterium]|nr:NUDIX hydrolase [Candidatus Saccharimonadales bacterium]